MPLKYDQVEHALVVIRLGCSADLNGLGLNTGPVHQVGGRGVDKVGVMSASNCQTPDSAPSKPFTAEFCCMSKKR